MQNCATKVCSSVQWGCYLPQAGRAVSAGRKSDCAAPMVVMGALSIAMQESEAICSTAKGCRWLGD